MNFQVVTHDGSGDWCFDVRGTDGRWSTRWVRTKKTAEGLRHNCETCGEVVMFSEVRDTLTEWLEKHETCSAPVAQKRAKQ